MTDFRTPVSVVIPAYNAEWCLRRAVDSVLAQTYTPAELIVVNDGSLDGTRALIESYGSAVRLVDKPNGGLSSARNAGMRAANGEWIAFLDADDWWLPRKLERQLTLIADVPGLVFCATAARVETPDGAALNVWHCGACQGNTLESIFNVHAYVAGSGSAVLARRETLLHLGGFDETLGSLEDIDMWMRLAPQGRYACIDETLVVILKHPGSMSRHLDVMRRSAIAIMHKNRALLPAHCQGEFWRHAYASMLADYAKWAYREGGQCDAIRDLLTAFCMAPFARGRLILSLLAAMLTGQKLP